MQHADVQAIGYFAMRHGDQTDLRGVPLDHIDRHILWGEERYYTVTPLGAFKLGTKPGTKGPLLGGFCWPFDPATPRYLPQWAFALPVIVETSPDQPDGEPAEDTADGADSGGATVSRGSAFTKSGGAMKFRPIHSVDDKGWNPSSPDNDMLGVLDAVAPYGDNFPVGTYGVILPGSNLANTERCFLPAGQKIIAPHFWGKDSHGTYVHDETEDGKVSKTRRAHIQRLMRVWTLPKTVAIQEAWGMPGEHSLAIQMGLSKKDTAGRAVFADQPQGGSFATSGENTQSFVLDNNGQITGTIDNGQAGGGSLGGTFSPPDPSLITPSDLQRPLSQTPSGGRQLLAGGSVAIGGCLSVGFPGDKHRQGINPDGEDLGPLHIPTSALYSQNQRADASLKFGGDWIKKSESPGPWVEVFLRYDDADAHPYIGAPGGMARGLWKWEVQQNVSFVGGGGGGGGGGGHDHDHPPPPDWPWDPDDPDDPPPPDQPDTPGTDTPYGGDYPGDGPVPPGGGGDITYGEDPLLRKVREQTATGTETSVSVNYQVGRQNDPAAQGYLMTLNSLSVPEILFQAENNTIERLLKGFGRWTGEDLRHAAATRPVIGKNEVQGAEQGTNAWNYTQQPGEGRFPTSAGTKNFLAPENSLHAIHSGTEPLSQSAAVQNYYKTSVSFAKPRQDGGIQDGFAFSRSADGSKLTIDGKNALGVTEASVPMVIDRTAATVTAFGVVLGGGGTDCCTGDEFGDGSDGDVSYAAGNHFPAADGFYT